MQQKFQVLVRLAGYDACNMSSADLQPVDAFDQIKRVLDTLTSKNIDMAAVPIVLVRDLKTATDHLRTILWGILTSSSVQTADIASATARVRAERVMEMCERLRVDIASGHISTEAGGVAGLEAALERTLDAVRRMGK